MSRQEFRMDLFIIKTLSQRPKSMNLSVRFRNFILRRLNIIARTTTPVDLPNERSFARDLAAFNSAGEGASLLDHVEDFAREAIRALPGPPSPGQTRARC